MNQLAGVVELFEDILNKEIAARIIAARALEAALTEGEVTGARVVAFDLEHPVGPSVRPPHVDDGAAHVGVRRVR